MKAVRNINPSFGEAVIFDNLDAMTVALANINGGENWLPEDGLKEGRDFEYVTYLMNPHTGSVDTEEGWIEDWKSVPEELWGGPAFEDADLIEVEKNADGDWVEAE